MGAQIMPIGKYKGQPVEVMLSDVQYANWLSEQPWFRKQYPVIQTLIVNNFGEATDTPEHNEFQASFFDEKYIKQFIKVVASRLDNGECELPPECDLDYDVETEYMGWDVLIRIFRVDGQDAYELLWLDKIFVEIKPCIGDDYPSVLRQMKNNHARLIREAERQYKSSDNTRWVTGWNQRQYLTHVESYHKIEMNIADGEHVLVYRDFNASSVPEEIVKKQFETSGYLAIKESEFWDAGSQEKNGMGRDNNEP